MTYYTIPPSTLLKKYIRYFWVLEGTASAQQPYIHRSLANSCPELFFHYKGVFDEIATDNSITRSATAGLHGQSQYISRFRIYDSFGIFGAYLYPFAIPVLFNIPASELSDHIPDLFSLLGNKGKFLEERMMLANNNAERVILLTKFLEDQLRNQYNHSLPVFSCITNMLQSKSTMQISQLAGQYFLSERQFERKFTQYAGFSPKLYSRIIRFQSTLGEYGNKQKSLTEIAYECGYYDQSHFIHDFKQFSGHHPKAFFYGGAEGTEWRS